MIQWLRKYHQIGLRGTEKASESMPVVYVANTMAKNAIKKLCTKVSNILF